MGNFYTNFTLKTSDADDVAHTLRQASRAAFVSPAQRDYLVVYEAEADNQDVSAIEDVGVMLSKQQKCPVLAVMNHDDDVLCYWLFDGGRLIDEYNSNPDYFDRGSGGDRGGDAELLCSRFGKPDQVARVRTILEDEDYAFALMRHEALCNALELPEWAVGAGYQYLESGEFPEGLSEDDIRRTE
jgi:hypothetical protein